MMEDIAFRLQRLEDIEAIKQLKARYFRALDTRNWQLMESCLKVTCKARYDNGKFSLDGRDAIIQFFRETIGDHRIILQHHGHHPEISLIDEKNASGIWYLQDLVMDPANHIKIQGAGFYDDCYEKINGRWLIFCTGYQRTYEMTEQKSQVTVRVNDSIQ